MNDTYGETSQEVRADEVVGRRPWLLLIHQLPTDPAYLRVKISRRLKVIGAIALKNSVYVLPDREGAREDFHWLRREIVAGGGDATLSVAQWLEGASDTELEAAFSDERAAEYESLASDAASLSATGSGARSELERLRRRLAAIEQRDYFTAPARESAVQALSDAARRLAADDAETAVQVLDKPVAAVWVTRRGVQIDRLASAWLIRRFIDPAARFRFVQPDTYRRRRNELRFDMYDGEFTHEGDRCTFETLVRCFDLRTSGLRQIGEIVHDIDCKDEKYGRAEAAGLASVVAGIAAMHRRDSDRLTASAPVFDGLLANFQGGT